MSVAAVVLAAGGSTRFRDGHKLLADFRGRPLWTWAVRHAVEAGLDETVLVVGPVTLEATEGVRVVQNPCWQDGLATSLWTAIEACGGHEAVVFGLADQPLLTAEAWAAVGRTPAPIAIATYEGRRGHPVRVASEMWELLPRRGDVGARELMRTRPELVVEVPCHGDPTDIDTVEDLRPRSDRTGQHRSREDERRWS